MINLILMLLHLKRGRAAWRCGEMSVGPACPPSSTCST